MTCVFSCSSILTPMEVNVIHKYHYSQIFRGGGA